MFKIWQKRNKKGFTLVEIIVVLVILALLAAASIPAMIGFINESETRSMITTARVCLNATQAVATEFFATKELSNSDRVIGVFNEDSSGDGVSGETQFCTVTGDSYVNSSAYLKLKSMVISDLPTDQGFVAYIDESGKVTKLEYCSLKKEDDQYSDSNARVVIIDVSENTTETQENLTVMLKAISGISN